MKEFSMKYKREKLANWQVIFREVKNVKLAMKYNESNLPFILLSELGWFSPFRV
jgi:hypothetical protein